MKPQSMRRRETLRRVLRGVESGSLSAEEALLFLHRTQDDLGFAKIDLDRLDRCGMPEVVFCPGKTAEQVAKICRSLKQAGQPVLATRASPEQYGAVRAMVPEARYNESARAILIRGRRVPRKTGLITVVAAGTSDIPVAEEAAVTAEWLGARVRRIYDVGVAGLHRLVRHIREIRDARAIVVVAGMEGALPSLVGGLVDRPIVAVPTSVGYGTSMKGLTALLAMLNSCVPGIAVMNIDNGFGAGVAAVRINRR